MLGLRSQTLQRILQDKVERNPDQTVQWVLIEVIGKKKQKQDGAVPVTQQMNTVPKKGKQLEACVYTLEGMVQ